MHKILIAGPGRCGTSFLVQFMEGLGLDAGGEEDRIPFYDSVGAGLDSRSPHPRSDGPTVQKNPFFTWRIKELGDPSWIRCVIICVREPGQVIGSRQKNNLWSGFGDVAPECYKGDKLIESMVGDLVIHCELRGIPYVIIKYPDLVLDSGYLWSKIGHLTNSEQGVFAQVHAELSDPTRVHEY